MNLNQSISKIRVSLQSSKINKSGRNKFAGFAYYELSDFLPTLNSLMLEYGVNDVFTVEDGYAILHLIKEDEKQTYRIPFQMFDVPLNNKGIPSMQQIQYLGALNTYYKRYLYLNAFGITDGEVIDSMNNGELAKAPTPSKQTPTQSNAISEWVKAEFAKHNIESDKFKLFMRWDKLTAKEMLTQATKFYNNRALWSDQLESYFTWLDNNENTALQGGE